MCKIQFQTHLYWLQISVKNTGIFVKDLHGRDYLLCPEIDFHGFSDSDWGENRDNDRFIFTFMAVESITSRSLSSGYGSYVLNGSQVYDPVFSNPRYLLVEMIDVRK